VNDKASVLAELAHLLSEQTPDLPLAHRLCLSASAVLGAEGGAITLAYTSVERVTLCATDERAARLEDLQDVLGQGPGPTAYDTGRQMRAALGAAGDERWPEFDRIATATLGPMDVRAIPMRPHLAVLGVLTCHLPEITGATFDEAAAQFLAVAIAVALLQDPGAYSTESSGPWSSRAQIHQATGMVVAQLRVGTSDALALLRAHAYAHGVSLEAVAASVVRRELDFRSPFDPSKDPPIDPTGSIHP
jgi:hypothetical protein